jgi:hypothetical protein
MILIEVSLLPVWHFYPPQLQMPDLPPGFRLQVIGPAVPGINKRIRLIPLNKY